MKNQAFHLTLEAATDMILSDPCPSCPALQQEGPKGRARPRLSSSTGSWVGEDPVLWSELSLLCFVLCPGLVSCAFFLAVSGLYSSSDDVIELTPSNFNREVIQSNSLWLVEFYAPWYVL